MTRQVANEVSATRARLVAAAKNTAPVTRRAAAQMCNDLRQWSTWKLEGLELPRLPRRIRVGLAKPAHSAKKVSASNLDAHRLEKINSENVQKQKPAATKLLGGALPTQKMLEYLAADYGVCIAIAMAITHSDQTAEEVVSECTASAVEQIQAGKVRADNAEKFHAWLHTIVRRNAMRRAGQSESTFVEYVEQGTSVDFGCTEFDHARVWGTGKGMPHAE